MAYIKKMFISFSGNEVQVQLLPNARQPLKIPTYDGSGQVVHPCVIDFLNEYGREVWSGFRYWMVLTPYPYSQDQYENPSLYASHDGSTWVVPKKILNPLITASETGDNGFLFDPDMVYDPDTDQIRIYYRFANPHSLKLLLIRINPDMTVTKPLLSMEQSPWSQKDNRTRSCCIYRESSDRWHMWGGGGTQKAPYDTWYFFSSDGILWRDPQRVVNQDGLDPFQAIGLSNWHMSGKPNSKEKRVEFLVYATVTGPVRKHLLSGKNPIVYAECSIDSPHVFRIPVASPVLLPAKSGWDSGRLYRCSFQIIDHKTAYLYGIWYSAQGSDGQWHIGYTKGLIGNSYRT